MEADRYAGRHGLNPGGVAFALGASGVLLFGLSLTAPNFVARIDKIFVAKSFHADQPPPPKPQPQPQPRIDTLKHVVPPPIEHVDVTPPLIPIVTGGLVSTHLDPPPLPTTVVGAGVETGTVIKPHVPVMLQPQLDSRYIDSFQPAYPSDERLAEHEGRVVVRVLIGTDGRVKDVQAVSAASPAFFEATRKRALEKWRFEPGTRDGVAIEAWQQMAVRFVLNED